MCSIDVKEQVVSGGPLSKQSSPEIWGATKAGGQRQANRRKQIDRSWARAEQWPAPDIPRWGQYKGLPMQLRGGGWQTPCVPAAEGGSLLIPMNACEWLQGSSQPFNPLSDVIGRVEAAASLSFKRCAQEPGRGLTE